MYPQKPNMRKASLLHSYREEILMIRRAPLVIVGIDLAGSPRRVTGLCVLRNLTAETRVAFSADDILDFVREAQPTLVPIDARSACRMDGGRSIDRTGEHLRECDRELHRRGIRFFPITLGPMRMLTDRGLALKMHSHVDGLSIRRFLPKRCTRFTTGGMTSDGRIKQRSDLLGKS